MVKEFEFNGQAMGTTFSVAIVCEEDVLANKMFEIAKKDILKYENQFSRFLPTSELSELNRKKDMIVSESFFRVATIAYQLYIKTKGIFNPLVSIARFGYDKNFTDIENSKGFLNESPYNIDFHSVLMNEDTHRIQLMEGQQFDFGGFLKGYLSEMIARKIKTYSGSISGIIVNIGGDIHTEGLDQNGNKFMFNIYNPIQGENDVSVVLYNQSLATSGTYKRSWLNSGKKVHHILDLSGERNPESNIISASVIHSNGSISEAFTKVFLSLNHNDALDLLGGKNISFVIIKNNGQVIKNNENIS